MILLTLIAVALGAGSVLAATPKIMCHEDKATMQATCVDVANVSAKESLRASAIFTGGPRGVTKTSHTIVVDCATKFVVLQDAKGVNFGGGEASSTAALRLLSAELCGAKPARTDNKLRMK